jgi:REP element-mobilizing transposase RayT
MREAQARGAGALPGSFCATFSLSGRYLLRQLASLLPRREVVVKQYRSFNRVYFHLIFWTKRRQPLIRAPRDEALLFGALKKKAHDLDAYLEELGSWYDHVHLLARTPPTLSPSRFYGQLKGFASYSWNRQRTESQFAWGDGVYISSVDPDDNEPLRAYIRNQRSIHAGRLQLECWEVADFVTYNSVAGGR